MHYHNKPGKSLCNCPFHSTLTILLMSLEMKLADERSPKIFPCDVLFLRSILPIFGIPPRGAHHLNAVTHLASLLIAIMYVFIIKRQGCMLVINPSIQLCPRHLRGQSILGNVEHFK